MRKSAIRRPAGRLVNYLLRPLNLRIISNKTLEQYKAQQRTIEHPEYQKKYYELINEISGLYNEHLPIPACENRSELLAELFGTTVSEAMYIIHYLHQSLKTNGDVCEFGVAMGATSALLANEIRATNKNLWLFDSFKGLPKPTSEDHLIDDLAHLGSMDKYAGFFSYPATEVQTRLAQICFPPSRTKIIDGFIENTIHKPDLPQKVCFAYLDFDLYNPISIVLNYLKHHLSPGGCIVVDDYGFFSSGVKKAVDEFVGANTRHFELSLPYKFAGKFCILNKTPRPG